MTFCIDIDGVITANPEALKWLTFHLCKNENKNKVYIISWRDGSDPERVKETKANLELFGITYHELIMAPRKLFNLRSAAYWKIKKIKELKVDIWMDDELKTYRRDLGVNID